MSAVEDRIMERFAEVFGMDIDSHKNKVRTACGSGRFDPRLNREL